MIDQVKRENLQIEYCPTDEVWGDFTTKPTQGAKPCNFRNCVFDENE